MGKVTRIALTALALWLVASPVAADGGVIHKMLLDVLPGLAPNYAANLHLVNAELTAQLVLSIFAASIHAPDLANIFFCKLSPSALFAPDALYRMINIIVLGRRYALQIYKAIVCTILIAMVNVGFAWYGAIEGSDDQAMYQAPAALAFAMERHCLMARRCNCRIANLPWPGTSQRVDSRQASYSALITSLIIAFIAGDWLPGFVRGKIGAHGDSFRCVMPRAVSAAPGPSIGLRPLYHIGRGIATC